MTKRRVKKYSSLALTALLVGGTLLPNLASPVKAASLGNVVISEVYGGGGNGGAVYKNDFIELYNPTDEDINLTGWSVQYGSATGSTYSSQINLTNTIKAHGYYLIKAASGGSAGADLPISADDTGTGMNLSATTGKVALVNGTARIATKADPAVIDFVGFGTANENETKAAPAPSSSKSIERKANDSSNPTSAEGAGKGNGWDTDDNSTDFVVADPNPQNTSSEIEPKIEEPPAPPEEGVTLLKDVRANNENGEPELKGQTVTVEGTVTVANNIIGSKTYYIQDATGGINIFDSSQEVTVGQKVRITGTVEFYRGLTEIKPTSVEVKGEGDSITPKDISIAQLNNYATAEPKEGMLVTVQGKVTDVPATASGGGYNVTLEDSGKATTVRVMTTTGIDTANILKVGSSYVITGIAGQYDSTSPFDTGYQIFPRNDQDITEYFALSLSHDPLTTVYTGNNARFKVTAEGADTVTVYYREKGASFYSSLEMSKGEQNQYTAVLPTASVPQNGLEYYIKAVNKSETKTAGTAEQPYSVQVTADTFAPVLNGFQPANNSIVETTLPEISFLVDEPSGLDESKLSIKLDNEEVHQKAIVSEQQVQLTLDSPLSYGKHTVVVEAWDTKGNLGTANWSFEVSEPFTGGNHYRGTTHNHTNISHDGAGTPEDALKAGIAHGYDWFAFSDHSHDIDADLAGKDTVDHNGMPERTGGSDWQTTKNLAKQYTNDDFVVFPAFEMTSTTWGHSNVFGTDNFIDRKINNGKYQDLNQYYAWVLTYDNITAQFNHPDMSTNAFNNFMPYDQNVDKLFTMFEVGNGSGHYEYANAEKKYFSALDLGWHVAPTYGEDNHEGTWGQTLNRTVIVSKDLKQESLLHSMQNMRVYMEEDPNFELDVKANGQYMGSIIDSKSLQFDIKGSDSVAESNAITEYNFLSDDYKSDDRIDKVELITNGNKVVDSIQPMKTGFTWNPSVTVTGGQQWFVVKITQMDGEQIYSSPIWTKEQDIDVRVSGLEVAGDAIVSGNPATLEAGISNLGKTELTNLNVKFYYDEVKDSNLIGTGKIDKLAPKGVGKASVVWDKPIAGQHTLIAVMNTPQGDSPEDNKFAKQVNIKESLGKTVMIDAAHKNENTSTDPGTYKNNFTAFTKLVQREGYTVVENQLPLTDEVLKGVRVLVMTHPEVDLTQAENDAVANFVKNGGSLFLTDKSNYNNTSTVNNDLLEQMGSTIQINNDGIFDDTKEGNFWSDPLKSKFAVRLHVKPVENYITDRADTIEYYSGASLEKVGHQPLTDSDTVTIIASGNETTYQNSVKQGYVYDDVSDDHGGSAIPAIASETIGKGHIVVSGMNFMNDKQLDESFNPKGNDEVALNAVNWLADRGTTITNIANARKLADDTEVVVEGTVTTAAGVFFDAFYVQDETGGIMAFNEVPEGSLKEGDRVRIYGHLKTFENNKELEFSKFDQDVIKLGSGDPVEPAVVQTGEAKSEANKGLLVKVQGEVVSKFDANSYYINDGTGDILVFTDGYIVNQSGPVPDLKIGDTLQAVGLSGSFGQGDRIRVRNTKELVKLDVKAPVTTAAVNPGEPTGKNGWYTSDVSVKLTASDDMSGVQNTQYRINSGDWTDYSDTIELTEDGQYKIEYQSKDAEGNTEQAKSVVVKLDKTAPTIDVSVDQPVLQVPNHKMVDINALVKDNDDTSGIESVVLKAIEINEENASSNDIQNAEYGTLDTLFSLRAERNGYGNGRTYTITYLATDKAGNTAEGKTTVFVPKGNSGK